MTEWELPKLEKKNYSILTMASPFEGWFVPYRLEVTTVNQYIKFEVPCFTLSANRKGYQNLQNSLQHMVVWGHSRSLKNASIPQTTRDILLAFHSILYSLWDTGDISEKLPILTT